MPISAELEKVRKVFGVDHPITEICNEAERILKERDEARDLLCEAYRVFRQAEDPTEQEDWWAGVYTANGWMKERLNARQD